jgi:alanyl aminopeptidase
VKQSLPEFLPLLSTGSRRQAPRLGSAFCDAAKAEEVKAFFSAHAAELPGAERPLAQTLEGIHLCVAAKAAHAASARAFFTGR